MMSRIAAAAVFACVSTGVWAQTGSSVKPIVRPSTPTALSGTTYRIIPDRIETGTFLCAVGMTGGEVELLATSAQGATFRLRLPAMRKTAPAAK